MELLGMEDTFERALAAERDEDKPIQKKITIWDKEYMLDADPGKRMCLKRPWQVQFFVIPSNTTQPYKSSC